MFLRILPRWLLLSLIAPLALAAEPKAFVPQGPMVRIWPGVAPGSEGREHEPERWVEGGTPDRFHRVTNVHVPTLTVYLPPAGRANGTACVIVPGGGHRYHVVDLEGELVAQRLNAAGIAAFVLRSRLARADRSTYRVEVESLADLQQALRVVRSRAAAWGVNPARVGVMGFSAGGHLAALAANQEPAAVRPDFAVLAYAALRDGNVAVTPQGPPTFLFVNDDDNLAVGSVEHYLALRKAKRAVELHVFRRGGHGVGATGRTDAFAQLGVAQWPELCLVWLRDLALLP